MRLGIGSYTYGWASGVYAPGLTTHLPRLSARDLIDRAAGYGLHLVQMVVRPALDELDDAEIAGLASYARRRGVTIETGTTGSDPVVLRRWLRVSRALGAPLMRTIFTDASPGLERERKNLREVLPAFREAGIAIAVENHERYSCDELLALLDDLGEGVGVCLDTVNSLGRGEGVREVIEALLPRTISLHVKDFRAVRGETDMGFTIAGAITGEGCLDIPALLAGMKRCNPEVGVIIEQWTPLTGSVADTVVEQERWADTGVAFLNEVVAKLH